MVTPDKIFTTVVLQWRTGGYPPVGFFSLWPDEFTFVYSKWLRYAGSIPLVNMLPVDIRPKGTEDKRIRFRVPFADLASMTSWKSKHGPGIAVHAHDGTEYFFTGGNLNPAFRFDRVVGGVAGVLRACGYAVDVTDDALTVTGVAG